MGVISEIPDYLSLAALSGTVLLTPLYLSQRRDVVRLRELRERAPDHPDRDIAASEALLDRAEQELEEVLIATGEYPAVAAGSTDPGSLTPIPPGERLETGVTPIPPHPRVTSDRPALERITMERDALAPHPRWRRFARAAMAPRALAVVALLAVAIGIAGLVASGQIFGGGNATGGRGGAAGAAGPGGTSVTVLNATASSKAGHTVARDVRKAGFDLASTADSRSQFQQTVVMFSRGGKGQATRVAHALNVTPIQPIDSETRSQAPNADVVVIVGTDRAQP
jgi:LytR cell envelope-related transcriptional attenuator